MAERLSRKSIARLSERDYLASFRDIDQGQIAEKLGQGMDHIVYAYGPEEVLKIPIRKKVYPVLTADEKEWELNIIHENFPENLLETKVLRSSSHPYYCLLQRRLKNFRYIQPQDSELLLPILNTNHKLLREQGLSLDFLGKDGMTRCVQALVNPLVTPEISNLVYEDREGSGQIVIPDFSIIKLGQQWYDSSLNGLRSRLVADVTFGLNRKLIKRFFRQDIDQ